MFTELTGEQRRQFVDATQVFEAWREAERDYRRNYRGSMRWKRVGGREYLYRVFGKIGNSLGPRSPETEAIKIRYDERAAICAGRMESLDQKLTDMARLNRAYNLGRMPATAARILRKLDAEGLLGAHLFVVGTHSLFAYEAAAGVRFESGLLASDDIDLLWDARRHLSLALVDVRQEGVLGLLRRVDRSFHPMPNAYRAVNDQGFYVDLIRPAEKEETRKTSPQLGDAEDDLDAAAIKGLEWLINAPKFERIVIGTDGRPLWMSCIDPRAFAVHKLWLSQQSDRAPIKKRRDAEQALAVFSIAKNYLGLQLEANDLSALPRDLVERAKNFMRKPEPSEGRQA